MARLSPEQFRAELQKARSLVAIGYENGPPLNALGYRRVYNMGKGLLDAHERAEAAEAGMGMWKLAAEHGHNERDEALGLCHDLEQERDDLRQRLAAAEALVKTQSEDEALWFPDTAPEAYIIKALRLLHATIEGDAEAVDALTPPAKEESGGVLHFAHAKHISPAKGGKDD